MASCLSLQLPEPSHFLRSFGSINERSIKTVVPSLPELNGAKLKCYFFLQSRISHGFWFPCNGSSHYVLLRASPSMTSSASFGELNLCNEDAALVESDKNEAEFNRVNCLVWILHQAALSFSQAVESLKLAGTGTELAMAWNGKDVHGWHKRIAYHVAVYALLKTAIEVEIFLSLDRHNNPLPVKDILAPKINLLGQYIESQLKMKQLELVEWFREMELPCIAGFFIPLLKNWSVDYAGSGVAGIVIAISCSAAIGKLGTGRISCPLLTLPIEDVLVELMDLSYTLVEVEKLHQLATEAGFELSFLTHFGAKVLSGNKTEELEFWIGLAQQKLSLTFQKEIVIRSSQLSDKKFQADSLATLGLFAYLGRKTRLFLTKMNVKDLDEMAKDFLSYLECGSLFIYPELASVSEYECFMEVVTDEIGWLDFYAPYSCRSNHERKRSKQHAIQAEKEIILSTVFTVCYDVFSGFAHFSRSTQQPLNEELLGFLLRSQSLLTICLEDYRAVYASSREPGRIAEVADSEHYMPVGYERIDELSIQSGSEQKSTKLTLQGCIKSESQQSTEPTKARAGTGAMNSADTLHQGLLRKYSHKFVSISSPDANIAKWSFFKDIWMGTQLLFLDILDSLELILKQLCGSKVSKKKRKKLKRTLNDIAMLIPITILMLAPVSAIGHAAILAAIKKYFPCMIPSPFSSPRLAVAKQLKRTKNMEIQSWSNLDDAVTAINHEDSSSTMP